MSEQIDPENIPQKYGGRFAFRFGMLPDVDLEIKNNVRWSSNTNGKSLQGLPKGPLKWTERRNGEKMAIAVGSVHGQQRNVPVMCLA